MTLAFRSTHRRWPQSTYTWDDENYSKRKLRPAATPEEQPIIPPAAIFSSLERDDTEELEPNSGFPSVAECAVHLELLEAFLILKQKIITSNALDRTFNLIPKDRLHTVGRTKTRKPDPQFKTRQAVKWPIYIRLAALRFFRWWGSLHKIIAKKNGAGHVQLSMESLPPLDVLMVWHAFLLNPTLYKQFCEKFGSSNLDFPWKQIHLSLSNNNRTFTLSEEAIKLFTQHAGAPDLFDALSNHASHSETTQTTLRALVPNAAKEPPQDALPEISLSFKPTALQWKFVNILAAQVERQSLFVQKMGDRLWLRSPALEGTLTRAITRYERFISLFKEDSNTILVPTIDIDLVWHTAQCSPGRYEETCIRVAGRVVNHDDTIGNQKLKGGFKETVSLYEHRFHEEFDACTCWECEALRSELGKWKGSASVDVAALAKKVNDEVAYYKAVEKARRKGDMLPVKV